MKPGLALTHGAGSNKDAPLLVAADKAFTEAGVLVRRFDLAFRAAKRNGPPMPAYAGKDRQSIREAAGDLRNEASPVLLGGHSYGGRQSTMAAAEDSALADGLVLFSYPLHPPSKPDQLRTAHFPELRTRCLFVHGTRDPFGSVSEMEQALKEIPAPVDLIVIEGAGHDLARKIGDALRERIVPRALAFLLS